MGSVQEVRIQKGQFYVGLVSLALTAVAIGLTCYVFSVEQKNRINDLRLHQDEQFEVARKEAQARDEARQKELPALICQTSRWVGETARVTLINTSPTYDAVIYQLRFRVIDAVSLDALATIHTRPEDGLSGGCPYFSENGDFVQGCWNTDGSYEFRADCEHTVPKGGVLSIDLRIANDFYRSEYLTGELFAHFNSPRSPFFHPEATIKATHSHLQPVLPAPNSASE